MDSILIRLLSDAWPMIIGATIGGGIIYLTRSAQPNEELLRRRLGRHMSLFSNVPVTSLDAAISAHARKASRFRPILWIAVMMVSAGLSASLYRLLRPDAPSWHSYLLGGVVAVFFGYLTDCFERRLTINSLRRILSQQSSQA